MSESERQEVFNKVVAIVAHKLKIDPKKIQETSTLHDLGADSLDLVEIIMKLEDDFNVQIDDEKAEKLKNIGDVVTYVCALVQQ
jgi:acyl carrier protein